MSGAVSHENLRHAVDLVFFEQWIRFYFITEEGGKYFIRIPDCEVDRAKELYPQLASVAEAMNNREVDHQAAVDALRKSMLEGPGALSGEQWGEILSGKDFRMTMELLHFWVQGDQESLDASPLAFHDWKASFELWSQNPGIKEYALRLLSDGQEGANRRLH